jgi:outer membrane receptor for ferrienterochelin and colicins
MPLLFAILGLSMQNPAVDSLLTVRVTGAGRPIAGAVVAAPDTSVTTDVTGVARLHLPPGRWRLAIAAVGFRPDSVDITVPRHTLEIALEALEELEELSVTATRTNRRIGEEPSRVEVLSREEIEEKLLMTPGDIQMLLNESSGLRVQSSSPSLGGATLRVQGLRGRYTQLLLDGLPLAGAQTGSLGLLQIPPMDLGRVEVVKGVASSFYGGSALGGVVNLVSRPPEGRELLLNQTTLNGTDAVLWLGGGLGGRWRGSLLAGGHRQSRRNRDGDGWTDVPGYRRLVLRPRAELSDESGRSVFLTSGLTIEGRDGGTLPGFTAPDGAPWVEALDSRRMDAGLTARLPHGHSVWALRAALASQHLDRRLGLTRERSDRTNGFLEATLTLPAGRGAFVLGSSLELDRLQSEDVPGFDYTFTVPALLAQYDWSPSALMGLTLTARLDHHSRYGTFVSPRMAARVSLGDEWALRLTGGTGFFGPTPFVEEVESLGLSRLNPLESLRAEQALGGSIDLGGTIGAVEVNATVFGSLLEHAAGLERTGTGQVSLVNSAGTTRTRGLELLARYEAGPLHFTATYTGLQATELPPGEIARRNVPYNPRHSAGLVGIWEREQRTRIGMELFFTGEQETEDDPFRSHTPEYVIVGLLAEHRIGRFRLFLNLENLTDRRQTRYGPIVRPEQSPEGRWTVELWAPPEGRVLNAGIRLLR